MATLACGLNPTWLARYTLPRGVGAVTSYTTAMEQPRTCNRLSFLTPHTGFSISTVGTLQQVNTSLTPLLFCVAARSRDTIIYMYIYAPTLHMIKIASIARLYSTYLHDINLASTAWSNSNVHVINSYIHSSAAGLTPIYNLSPL